MSGVDEFELGLETLGERLQLVGAVARPEVVPVVVRGHEVGPFTVVHQYYRHLKVAECLGDELASCRVVCGIDDVVFDLELVELAVRCVTLDTGCLAKNSHGHVDDSLLYARPKRPRLRVVVIRKKTPISKSDSAPWTKEYYPL